MPQFRVTEDTPSRMVITQERGWKNPNLLFVGLFALFGILFFFIVLGRNPDATAWVVASCSLAFMSLPALASLFENLYIVVDASRRVISRESKVFGVVLLSQEIPFDEVDTIAMYDYEPFSRPGRLLGSELTFGWTVAIIPRTGRRLLINTSIFGYDEMVDFAKQVARRLGKSLNIYKYGQLIATLPDGS